MLGRTVAFVGCVFAFVAVVIPRADTPDGQMASMPDGSGAQNTAASSANTQANDEWYAGDHTLKRQSDGHFYASATVDGAPVRMMVDTGASVIALTGADASAAGIYWDDADVRPIGRGASGTVYGVATQLSEVEIGGMVRRNVSAIIVPEGLDISLLGQSYLAQIGAVQINGDTMVMSGG